MDERVQTNEPKETPPAGTPESSGTQYEFTEQQNEVMRQLDAKLGVTGGFVLIAALGATIALAVDLFKGQFPYHGWAAAGAIVVVLLAFAHGAWLCNASTAFEKIHKTRGRDIDHLMDALNNLSRFFTLMSTLAAVIIIGSVIHAVIRLFF